MHELKPPLDPGIYLLADHLDATLAAGEDLLAAELAAPADIDRVNPGDSAAAIAAFANNLRRLEASIAARILQARRRAAELSRLDQGTRAIITLFMSSTSSTLDLIEHFSRQMESASFDPANLTPYAVLRSRGLLAADAAELPRYSAVNITEAYLIGGLVPLGELLNIAARTLDALDLQHDLYLDRTTDTEPASVDAEVNIASPVAVVTAAKAAYQSATDASPQEISTVAELSAAEAAAELSSTPSQSVTVSDSAGAAKLDEPVLDTPSSEPVPSLSADSAEKSAAAPGRKERRKPMNLTEALATLNKRTSQPPPAT